MTTRKSNGGFRLIVPREHGAWAMLLVPYVTGLAASPWTSGVAFRAVCGLAGILLLFMARSPLMFLARQRIRRGRLPTGSASYWSSAALYLSGAFTAFGLVVVSNGWLHLPRLALFVTVAALVQSWLAIGLGERSFAAEFTGVLLLTLTAPLGVMMAGATGIGNPGSLLLWGVNATFFTASIFNVKMKVASMMARRGGRTPPGRAWPARGSIAYLALTLFSWSLLSLTGNAPTLAPVVFTPLVAYLALGLVREPGKLKIRTEGFVQLGMSVAFTALVIIAWRIG